MNEHWRNLMAAVLRRAAIDAGDGNYLTSFTEQQLKTFVCGEWCEALCYLLDVDINAYRKAVHERIEGLLGPRTLVR